MYLDAIKGKGKNKKVDTNLRFVLNAFYNYCK